MNGIHYIDTPPIDSSIYSTLPPFGDFGKPQDCHFRPFFGCEFQFVVKVRGSTLPLVKRADTSIGSESDTPTENDWVDDIAARLRIAISDALRNRNAPSYKPSWGSKRFDYNYWCVTTDTAITVPLPSETGGYDTFFVGVVVNSRVLSADWAGYVELQNAVRAITGRFTTGVNESCRFRVYVGNKGRSKLDLWTLKTLAGLMAGWEPQMNSLHPAHRCHPGSESPPLSNMARLHGKTRSQRVMAIDACDNTDELFRLLAKDRGMPVIDLNRPCPSDHALYRTVEFRQHEGTLEEDRMVMWVRLAAGMVKGAFEVSDRFCSNLMNGKGANFTILELLRSLGMHDIADYYKDKLHWHEWASESGGMSGYR
ncbi:hypothetical protein GP486_006513 [Trichoglossum hirsutum]|uniref:Uncharacterized protein n=1 Tax=Trichoglossum hirsutum TaxID=265104 RepID=A0A9P8L5I9_9PEZI|nr:hypothetical protein GP486_006513 [Trichoglossum hirsutum]